LAERLDEVAVTDLGEDAPAMAEDATTGKRAKEEEAGGSGAAGEGGEEPAAKRAKEEAGAGGAAAAGVAAGTGGSPAGAGAPAPALAGGGADLLASRPATKAKLEWLYATGKMAASEMTESTLQQLCQFSDSKGVEIVEQFAVADLNGVKNKAGFFGGVIKRYRDMQAAPASLGAAVPGAVPAAIGYPGAPGGVLWPAVQAKLDSLYSSGALTHGVLDQRCMDQLKTLSETSALEVVNKFAEADLSTIKSKGGFFMGIIKRFKEQERGVFASLSPAQFAGVAPMAQSALLVGQQRADLWPLAKLKLDAIFAAGQVQPGELDSRCMEQLRSLPEYLALEVVTKFGEADLSQVRSALTLPRPRAFRVWRSRLSIWRLAFSV